MRIPVLFLSLVAGLTVAAHADTFNFSGSTTSGSVGTGTITSDSSGDVNGGQIILTGGTSFGTYTFYNSQTNYGFPTVKLLPTDGKFTLTLYLQSALLNASSVQVCGSSNCIANVGAFTSSIGRDTFDSGTLTLQQSVPTAPTPEPSSLILLGSGVLGMAGAARRRFFARR